MVFEDSFMFDDSQTGPHPQRHSVAHRHQLVGPYASVNIPSSCFVLGLPSEHTRFAKFEPWDYISAYRWLCIVHWKGAGYGYVSTLSVYSSLLIHSSGPHHYVVWHFTLTAGRIPTVAGHPELLQMGEHTASARGDETITVVMFAPPGVPKFIDC